MRTTNNTQPRNAENTNVRQSSSSTSAQGVPWAYLALVLLFSIPFYFFGASKLPLPMNLPASALMFVCPALAAGILTFRVSGFSGVRALVSKAWDFKKIKSKKWYLPILLLVPAIYSLIYFVLNVTGLPLPAQIQISFQDLPIFILLFFIAATGEELGWSGYAIDPMQKRYGAFVAALVLGVVWQVWHIVPDLQASHSPLWILWHSLYSIGLRVLIVWIYNNTGKSVFAAILVHAGDNVSWSMFPNFGSHFDPLIALLITVLFVAGVTFLWGPQTLCRYRYANSNQTRAQTVR